MDTINNGLFFGITVNLILSTWIIPLYIGTKRELGYGKSMLSCIFLTPLIGIIITLISPKNDAPSKSNHYPIASFLAFFILLMLHYVLLINEETIFWAFENPKSVIITLIFWFISLLIGIVFKEISKRHSNEELILMTIFPTIYLIYVAIVGKNPKYLKAENTRKSQNDFNTKKNELTNLYKSNLIDENEFRNKLSLVEQEMTKKKIEEQFYESGIYFQLKKAKDNGILTESEFEVKIKEQKEKYKIE